MQFCSNVNGFKWRLQLKKSFCKYLYLFAYICIYLNAFICIYFTIIVTTKIYYNSKLHYCLDGSKVQRFQSMDHVPNIHQNLVFYIYLMLFDVVFCYNLSFLNLAVESLTFQPRWTSDERKSSRSRLPTSFFFLCLPPRWAALRKTKEH